MRISGLRGGTHAFIPDFLPPAWEIPRELWPLVRDARAEIAALDGIGRYMPNPQLLLNPLQYREAQLSSRLEGTFASPRQLMLFEMAPEMVKEEEGDIDAVKEVVNYKRALNYQRQVQEKLPLSLRLIRDLHKLLLSGVRGGSRQPGVFRQGQVQIGRPARFVPPPANELGPLLDNLEKQIHQPITEDPLVDAFIVHYQFEAIHPFEDGNGRVGRLLLALMIAEGCRLAHHWLYMSAFFDAYRDEYLDRLFRVSSDGDWSGWIEFCLRGAVAQAKDTAERSAGLLGLLGRFKEEANEIAGSYGSHRLVAIVEGLFMVPVIDIPSTARAFEVSYPTAQSDVEKLVAAGILTEMEDTRPRAFYCREIVELIYESI